MARIEAFSPTAPNVPSGGAVAALARDLTRGANRVDFRQRA
jgi:hypothetical protein